MITEWPSFVFSSHDHTVAFLMLMFCEIIYAQWECTQVTWENQASSPLLGCFSLSLHFCLSQPLSLVPKVSQ